MPADIDINPYYEDDGVLPTMTSESVDFVLTDS
jgi:hypothetical protein